MLNTWLIPNDTREPADRFDSYARAHRLAPKERETLRRLRDDLRAMAERDPASDELANRWIAKLGVVVTASGRRIVLRHGHGDSRAGDIMVTVLEAMADRRWDRLKACPDCRWVFYDNSRNASKRWCLMNAGGPNGRACGTIAKVRRYRRSHGADQ